MNQQPISLTRTDILETDPSERVALVQNYVLKMLDSVSPPGSEPAEPTTRLAEAGMDSLQVVELKFALDELLGRESDVEMFISNPTIGELSQSIVAAAGL